MTAIGKPAPHSRIAAGNGRSYAGRHGVFTCVDEAVAAADRSLRAAQRAIGSKTASGSSTTSAASRSTSASSWARWRWKKPRSAGSTHKIEKLKTLGERTPGVEFLRSEVFSGDHGLAVIEHAPFGVIGAITPVTHSLPTITGNAVSMIAGGNTLVVNPHPSGKRVAAEGVRRFNQAIYRDLGIDNLICVIAEPTLESADAHLQASRREADLRHRRAGRGPGRHAKRQAGDRGRAGQSAGGRRRNGRSGPRRPGASFKARAYDNNLLCIAEKEVFVVGEVFDEMLAAMERAGAVRLNAREVDALTNVAITPVGEGDAQARRRRARSSSARTPPCWLAAPARTCRPQTELLFGETDEHNPFVPVEQMMPFLPFVRVRDVDEAIDKAKYYEHGFRHTSIIHSNNVRNMTKMGRAMDTTLFVKNGPCMAALGLGGEGYLSFSIATPTGEGVTTPLTFTRERRCSMIDDLRIIGKP